MSFKALLLGDRSNDRQKSVLLPIFRLLFCSKLDNKFSCSSRFAYMHMALFLIIFNYVSSWNCSNALF